MGARESVHPGALLRMLKLFRLSIWFTCLGAASLASAQGQPYLVKDINAALTTAGSSPGEVTQVGSALYFVTTPASENALWKTDGTGPGTVLVKPLGWPARTTRRRSSR